MTELKRETKETNIELELKVYGTGKNKINSGVGFFDHMLEGFSKHSLIDLNLNCKGDTYVDFHHTVEDIGIVLGEALHKEIFPVFGVERFANSVVVMDESAIECVVDLSNRPFLHFDIDIDGKVGEFDCELVEEFFRAVTLNSKITMHLVKLRGKNRHHIIEATFKAFGVAIRRAVAKNKRVKIPSTKGML